MILVVYLNFIDKFFTDPKYDILMSYDFKFYI